MKADSRMPSSEWAEVTFGEIFDISSSKRVLEAQWKKSGVPFYRAREIVKLAKEGSVQNELFISEELFRDFQTRYGAPEPGDLMVSAVGTLGACYVVQPDDRFYFKDASVLRFSPKQPVDSRFIQHAFRTDLVLDQVHAGSGSTVGTYTISRANATRLSLPPLAEQRRIAEVLDRAEALRAKRRAALAQLDSLTQSLFLDLFGDPVRNEKGWPCHSLSEVAVFENGDRSSNYPSGDDIQTEGVLFLSTKNIVEDRLNLSSAVFITPEKFRSLSRGKAQRMDLIITLRGTLGSCCIFDCPHDTAFINAQMMLVRPRENVIPKFLHALLTSKQAQDRFTRIGHGAAVPQLTAAQLSKLPIPLPPIALQREFTRRVTAVEALKTAQRASLAELDALFATLQHRAFRGGL